MASKDGISFMERLNSIPWVHTSAVIVISLLLLLAGGCEKDVHDHPKLTTGKQLFEHHCAPCHGKEGEGAFLEGIPANRDTQLDFRQIAHKIKAGGSTKSKMPVFKKMGDTEAAKIAQYLESLKR
ncbi:MAG: c-type cytochrome [Thermodesulfobacteriota bacterium]